MSFSDFGGPGQPPRPPLLRGNTLQQMFRGVSMMAGASLMAAIYQLASDEARAGINGLRLRALYTRQRHELILMATVGTRLPSELQNRLLRSRDAWKAAMKILADPLTSPEDVETLRQAVARACNSIPEQR